jgi:cytochrome c553
MIGMDVAARTRRLHVAVAVGAAWLPLAFPVCSLADEVKSSTPMTHYESPKGSTQQPDTGTGDQPDTAAKAPEFSPHATFSSICGFCHEDGGRKAGKGPQLMGTDKTDDQIFNRIKFGKPGRMAAFGGAFTDDQIKQLIVYIRNLKPRQ